MPESEIGPHYGCPRCGSPRFEAIQQRIEYSTERVYATYVAADPDSPAYFDVDEYADPEYYDSEPGEMEPIRTCRDCGKEYEKPVFCDSPTRLEEIAARSGLKPSGVEPFEWIFATLKRARAITVTLEGHATVIDATANSVEKGYGPSSHRWTVHECCRCGAELERNEPTIRQAYRLAEDPGCRERVYDSRLLPVLVRSTLCAKCA